MKNRMIRLEAEDTKDNEPRNVSMSRAVYEAFKTIPRAIHVDHVFLYNGKSIKAEFH